MFSKKIRLTFIIVIVAVFCAVAFLTIYTQEASRKTYRTELENKIYYANISYASEIDRLLEKMETIADTVAWETGSVFAYRNYVNDEAAFSEDKIVMDDIVRNVLSEEDEVSSLYITFDPRKFPGRQEIWYIRDHDGEIEYVDSAKMAKTWLLESNPNTKYFYDAMKNGNYWGGPDWETILSRNNITYTSSLVDRDGVAMGIVGVDIVLDDISKLVENIKVGKAGNTYLMNDEYECIARNDDSDMEEGLKKYLEKKALAGKDEQPEMFSFDSEKLGSLMVVESCLSNGWHLVCTQPEKIALEPANTSIMLSILLVLFTFAVMVIAAVFLYRKSVRPVIIKAEDQQLFIINQSRQAKLGELIGNITHQLKQPINNINIVLLNMQEDMEDGVMTESSMREQMDALQSSVDVLVPIIDDFAGFLKPDREKSVINIHDEIKRCMTLIQMRLKMAGIKINVDADREINVYGYRNELCQCILNLLTNAADAAAENEITDRNIEIESYRAEDSIYIKVFNNGNCIEEDKGKFIFEPYVTTKQDKGGTGMGLYIAREIIVGHFHGRLYYNNVKNGVEFIIELPVNGGQDG